MRTIKHLAPAIVLLLAVALLVKRYLVPPSPDRILQQTLKQYESLEYYSDTTTVRSDVASLGGSYEFAYARPNRLRVQFRELLDDQLVIVDGITLYVYRPSVNEYRARPAPRELSDELPGAQQMLKLSLLNGTALQDSPGTTRYIRREKLEAGWMHKIEVKPQPAATAVRRGQPRGDREEQADADPARAAEQSLPPMTLWIGEEDGLVHRVDMTLAVGSAKMTQSLVSEGISTEATPADTFAFHPPPGARPVARFEAPRVEYDVAPGTEGQPVDKRG